MSIKEDHPEKRLMVTLINHPGLKTVKGLQLQTPSPSIGLAYIGGYLRSKEVDYKGVDGCGEALEQVYPYNDRGEVLIQGLRNSEILERIPLNASIIGFSCLFSECWPLVYQLAREVKNHFPKAHMVAGGEHPTALPEPILRSGIFDTVTFGEGEETFYELVSKIKSGEDWRTIDGVMFIDSEGRIQKNGARKRMTDIDKIPYPDWGSWPLEQYINQGQVSGIQQGRSMPILGSRGCPYACTFCSNEDMWTRRYVTRGAKQLVDEMEHWVKHYQVNGFTFFDSTFIVNRRKTFEFAQELTARKLGIGYQLPAGTRCEAFDDELARELEKSGLKNFALAPESGSPEILKAIKKQIDIEKLYEAVRAILKTKMTVACFIVIGFPEDTAATLKPTLKLIRKLAYLGIHDVTVSKFTPYPGSPYYKRFVEQGRCLPDFQSSSSLINFFDATDESFCDSISAKQLHRYMMYFFLNFYIISMILRPWRFLKNLGDLLFHGVENTRYMRLVSELLFKRRKWKGRLAKSEGFQRTMS